MKILRVLKFAVLAYAALYLTIWFHELGHGFVYWLYGCKTNVFDLQVPFHFGGSNPGPLVSGCEANLSSSSQIIAALGGMGFNLLMIIFILVLERKTNRPLLNWFLTILVVSSYLEIISYLTIGNIFPTGDMVTIRQYAPGLQVILFLCGLYALIYMLKYLRMRPLPIRSATIIFSILTFTSMVFLRIIFVHS